MIPVFGVPVLDRYDLLEGMESTIDVEVDRYYVVDNGGKYEATLGDTSVKADSTLITRLGVNLGFAASVNLIIRANLRAPWWFITNDDIRFAPGALASLDTLMWENVHQPTVCLLFGYSAFAVNDKAIEKVGWFDENYHPAYCEDSDWQWRAEKLGIHATSVDGLGTTHLGSQTIANRERGMANNITYPKNVLYHRAKWGGDPFVEVFPTPFNGGGDVDTTLTPKLSRLRELAW